MRFAALAVFVLATAAPAWAQAGAGSGQAAGGGQAQGRAQRPPQNLKVLPPTTNLRNEMQRIAASLGVKCDFCHVQGNNASDEKKEKLTARRMMEMVKEINAKFPNHETKEGDSPLGSAVTCYTCHHGEQHPATVPPKEAVPGF